MEDIERKKEMEGKKGKKGEKGAEKKKKTEEKGGSDDIVHSAAMAHAAKILERMANQNTFADVTEDFKFWEDQSDLYRDESTLLPLWRFSFIVILLLDVPTGKGPNAVADAALQVHQRDPLARAVVDEHGGNTRS